ncbi:MAG: DsbA family protein [Acidobacteriia bacterium]|nr:DsbA family protein [Terriglobia bacterium]
MLRLRLLPAIILTVVLGLAASLALTAAPPQAKPAAEVDPHKAFGSKSAPITMEVFSDFQCPACRTLYMTIWRQLLRRL